MTAKEEIVASLEFRISEGNKEIAFHRERIRAAQTRISQLEGAIAELHTLKEMAAKESWPATDAKPQEPTK